MHFAEQPAADAGTVMHSLGRSGMAIGTGWQATPSYTLPWLRPSTPRRWHGRGATGCQLASPPLPLRRGHKRLFALPGGHTADLVRRIGPVRGGRTREWAPMIRHISSDPVPRRTRART